MQTDWVYIMNVEVELMVDNRIEELLKKRTAYKMSAPDGTPLYYSGPLVLDGDVNVVHAMEEAAFNRKLKREKK